MIFFKTNKQTKIVKRIKQVKIRHMKTFLTNMYKSSVAVSMGTCIGWNRSLNQRQEKINALEIKDKSYKVSKSILDRCKEENYSIPEDGMIFNQLRDLKFQQKLIDEKISNNVSSDVENLKSVVRSTTKLDLNLFKSFEEKNKERILQLSDLEVRNELRVESVKLIKNLNIICEENDST